MSQPHNLHTLTNLGDNGTVWVCRCGHRGTAPTAEQAVEDYRAHRADATYLVRALAEAMDPTSIYAAKEPTC
jgi:hypothetical protein